MWLATFLPCVTADDYNGFRTCRHYRWKYILQYPEHVIRMPRREHRLASRSAPGVKRIRGLVQDEHASSAIFGRRRTGCGLTYDLAIGT
jgi:hypothetical protein